MKRTLHEQIERLCKKLAKELAHTLFAYEVADDKIEQLKKRIRNKLQRQGVPCEFTDSPSHISVAFVDKSYDEDLLEHLLQEGEGAGNFRGSELTFLQGRENWNFIAVKLDPSANFFQFQKEIEKQIETKKFPGGFKAHISLVKAPKSQLTEDVWNKIKDSFDAFSISVKPTKVVLFNEQHQVEMSVRAARR